jgi:hypothetical protein
MLLQGLHRSWIGISFRRSVAGEVSSSSDRMGCITALISRWMASLNLDRVAQAVDLISAWLDLMSSRMDFVLASIIPFSTSLSASAFAWLVSAFFASRSAFPLVIPFCGTVL